MLQVLSLLERASLEQIREHIVAMRASPSAEAGAMGPLATQLLHTVSSCSGIAELMAAYYSSITLLEESTPSLCTAL